MQKMPDRIFGENEMKTRSNLIQSQLNTLLRKNSILIDKVLSRIGKQLCKDCQKITSNDNLRCLSCKEEHDYYIREKIECDLRDDYLAELELEQ